MYIAEKFGEIREIVYRLALELLLKKMPHSVVFVIVIIYIGLGYPLHYVANGLSTFLEKEMYMVAHQAIGIDMSSGLKGLTLCVNIRLRLPTKNVEETY